MGPDTIWVVIPVTALMIPIMAIMTRHRQRIAEIKYSARPVQNSDEVATLRREVNELKEMVHTQMLLLDRYSKTPMASTAPDELTSRISQGR